MKEEEEKRLDDEDSLVFYSRETANQVHRSSSSRSKRVKSRTPNNKPEKSKLPSPKRRSTRLHSKVDNNSAESNDSIASENFRTSHKPNSHDPKRRLVNGSADKNFISKNCALRRTSWNNIKNCEKVSSSPLNLKPFSNPNLVIRTRRASAIEAEDKSKSESDSELCSPKSSSLFGNKDVTVNDNSTNSSFLSETS